MLDKMVFKRPESVTRRLNCPADDISIIQLLRGQLYEKGWIPTKREFTLGIDRSKK